MAYLYFRSLRTRMKLSLVPRHMRLAPSLPINTASARIQAALTSQQRNACFSATPLPQTMTEKIVQRYAVGLPGGKLVRSGDYISISPEQCMTHDNSWPVASKFMSMGATRVHRPSQIVIALDHDISNNSESNLRKYQQIEAFAKAHDIFFMRASGYVLPEGSNNLPPANNGETSVRD